HKGVDSPVPRFRRNLWLLLAQNLAVFLGIAVQALILNLYLIALGYREDFIGLVAFVQTAAIGAGAMPASWLAPRVGVRRVLVGGNALFGYRYALLAGSLFSALGALPLLVADDTRVEASGAPPPPSGRPHPDSLPAGEGTRARQRSLKRDMVAMAAATTLLAA